MACRLHRGSYRRPADLSVVSGLQDPSSQVVRHSELSAGNRRGRPDLAEEHLRRIVKHEIALVAGQG